MKKLSLFVVEHERTPQPDGRVFEEVTVDLRGKSTYHWKCICRPEDGHDHEAVVGALAAGLAHRLEALPKLAALVGRDVTVGKTTAVITDSNIQIQGPADWPLYLAWKYADGRMEDRTIKAATPLRTPRAEDALGIVKAAVAKSDERARAASDAAAFVGEVSSADPAV